jgi:UDP-N-acetylglucosamine kinase
VPTNDAQLSSDAIKYVKSHADEIISRVVESAQPATHQPLSIFMAGSPGAGKTEFSKRLIPILEQGGIDKIIRIDPDDLRIILPGYSGTNSHLFQGATSVGVEKVHDYALEKGLNFLLDGTLSNSAKALHNVGRSIRKGRAVVLFYIFLEPAIAWELTQKREALEGRRISKEAFVNHLCDSYQTVDLVQRQYGESATVFVVDKKTLNPSDFTITAVKTNLASYKPMSHDKDQLMQSL